MERVIPRNSITSTLIFRTPLLRLAGACVLVIFTPGMWAVLPGIPLEEADAISGALLAGGRSLSLGAPDGGGTTPSLPCG